MLCQNLIYKSISHIFDLCFFFPVILIQIQNHALKNYDQLDLTAIPFINSTFYDNETEINLVGNDENLNIENSVILKRVCISFISTSILLQ